MALPEHGGVSGDVRHLIDSAFTTQAPRVIKYTDETVAGAHQRRVHDRRVAGVETVVYPPPQQIYRLRDHLQELGVSLVDFATVATLYTISGFANRLRTQNPKNNHQKK